MPTSSSATPNVKKSWLNFFCCCFTKKQEQTVLRVSPKNPARDTTRLLKFTDINHNPITAFFVVQAIKVGDMYQTPICYASPQAEILLESNQLIGVDLASLMPHQNFIKTHSQLIGRFFEDFQATGKNPSPFIGKGAVHGLRNFTVKLPNGRDAQFDFTLDHTISKDAETGKPIFFIIARLPTQEELQNERPKEQVAVSP